MVMLSQCYPLLILYPTIHKKFKNVLPGVSEPCKTTGYSVEALWLGHLFTSLSPWRVFVPAVPASTTEPRDFYYWRLLSSFKVSEMN